MQPSLNSATITEQCNHHWTVQPPSNHATITEPWNHHWTMQPSSNYATINKPCNHQRTMQPSLIMNHGASIEPCNHHWTVQHTSPLSTTILYGSTCSPCNFLLTVCPSKLPLPSTHSYLEMLPTVILGYSVPFKPSAVVTIILLI